MFGVISPVTPQHYDLIFDLRYRVLREPWDQPKGSERDDTEESSVHAMILDENGSCIASGRLHVNNAEEGQIRYMAVENSYRGKGLGKLILKFLEEKASEAGMRKIVLQARENALDFYRGQGYSIEVKSFLLFDAIQHYKMIKFL